MMRRLNFIGEKVVSSLRSDALNKPRKRKIGKREKYSLLTKGLDWELSYKTEEEVFPYATFEGIKIHDWDKWEDPFRLTVDTYWKYQAEKERKLYAVIDAFAQNSGQFQVSDARYINAAKLFLTGITPLEYNAHRGFAHVGRQLPGVSARIACQMQAIDELRHAQTQIHTLSQYNKYFNGFHDFMHMHDRVWYLSVPKSFIEDTLSAGPFEFLTAISFSFEYVLTNLLFMPFMSGAAYNGDMATVTFGFSAQSDEARHMTLGLEIIRFMLEQDEGNIPIVQRWIDKWFWRSFRLLTLVGMMMDYMLPKRVMSWSEAWEIYFEEAAESLFTDLERYGIRMPKYADQATKTKDRITHEAWTTFYQYRYATGFHVWLPDDNEMDWLSQKYPATFDQYYRPRFDHWRSVEESGKDNTNPTLGMLCSVCQLPTLFSHPDDPGKLWLRETSYEGNKYQFCSDGCHDIFVGEPEKYVQSWLPVYQVYQGNCGGADIEDVKAWWHVISGSDDGDYVGSPDQKNWERWTGRGADQKETQSRGGEK